MNWTLFLTYLAACGAASATGAMIKPGEWYDSLKKPTWTPPGWVFPVVWTLLYLMMAVAGMRLSQVPGSEQALALWSLQIALNTLWTPVYFGLHRIRAAMVVMAFLWLTVAAATWSFFAVDVLSGFLFVPYLVWVTIAGALNLSTLRLNPQAA
ncbi:MAG: tryptophan-rich sensory protein [Candidatus Saccharibacteria bacterium]|nr:tryptophan-rich sensory protein [Pseudorhodobacter sp.]